VGHGWSNERRVPGFFSKTKVFMIKMTYLVKNHVFFVDFSDNFVGICEASFLLF
jgi:hypothetical protein